MNIRKFLDIINRTKNLKLNLKDIEILFFSTVKCSQKIIQTQRDSRIPSDSVRVYIKSFNKSAWFLFTVHIFPSKNFLRLLHTANHILNIGTVPFLPSANFVPFLQFFAGSVSIFRDYPWINSLFMKIVSILSRYCKLQ